MLSNYYCPGDPTFLKVFDLSYAPTLLFYAYIPIIIISIFLGVFVLVRDKYSIQSKLLLLVALFFSFWSLNIVLQWVTVPVKLNMFLWEMTMFFEIFIFLLSIYFTHVFVSGSDISFKVKLALVFLGLPIMVFLPTTINVVDFDVVNCQATVGYLTYYVYCVEVVSIIWIAVYSIKNFFNLKVETNRKQTLFFAIGIAFFLTIFSLSNILGEFTKVYEINLFGPLGMAVFIGLLSYIIVRFKTFNIKMLGAQVLVIAIVVLVGSQFFFIQNQINRVLTGITLVITAIIGVNLIRSVKKEVEQRENIEKLAKDLEKTNSKLSEVNTGQASLIHFMNHQIKGRFGVSKNIFAELMSNDYGTMPPATQPLLQKGLDEADAGVRYLQSILNGASAEMGTLPYDMKPMDMKSLVEMVFAKQKEYAEKKGLTINLKIGDGDYSIVGDVTQLGEAVRNMIDNSVNYTPSGNIDVELSHTEKGILYKVKDTGVGVTDEDKVRLFKAGGRGINSLKVNVNATGYGLVFVKNVALAHKGHVWVESAGHDKGSTFYMEIPKA